ncbi:hypothetical protein Pd630_LPD04783 [Rhodococcus opacus PD630]|nr:hypothetical protein Pd630_LPD04783 [Rhodococcus opacus PD630]
MLPESRTQRLERPIVHGLIQTNAVHSGADGSSQGGDTRLHEGSSISAGSSRFE